MQCSHRSLLGNTLTWPTEELIWKEMGGIICSSISQIILHYTVMVSDWITPLLTWGPLNSPSCFTTALFAVLPRQLGAFNSFLHALVHSHHCGGLTGQQCIYIYIKSIRASLGCCVKLAYAFSICETRPADIFKNYTVTVKTYVSNCGEIRWSCIYFSKNWPHPIYTRLWMHLIVSILAVAFKYPTTRDSYVLMFNSINSFLEKHVLFPKANF